MKCPGCKFVCSDLRDICPRCLSDLRPQKHLLGLPIAQPLTPYRELVSKQTQKQSKQQSAPRGLLAGLSRFFAGQSRTAPPQAEVDETPVSNPLPGPPVAPKSINTPRAPEPLRSEILSLTAELEDRPITDISFDLPQSPPATETKEAIQPPPETPHVPQELSAGLPQQPAPAVLDLSTNEQNLETILDSMLGDEELTTEAVKVEKPTKNDLFGVEFEFEEPAQDPPPAKVGESAPPLAACEEIQAPLLGPEPMSGELIQPEMPPPAPITGDTIERELQTASILVADTDRPITPLLNPISSIATTQVGTNDAVQLLFDDADRELRSTQNVAAGLEFGVEQLHSTARREEIAVLFDVATEVLTHPDSATQYVEPTGSETVSVKASTELRRELHRTELAANQQIISLAASNRSQTVTSQTAEQMQNVNIPPQPANAWQRTISVIGDTIFVLLISALFTGARFSGLLFGYAELTVADRWGLVSAWLILALLLIPFYQVLLNGLTGKTPGDALSGTELRTLSGATARFEHILCRSLCSALSFLCFGWLPALFGKRSLHDRLAGTDIFISKSAG